MLLIIQTMGDLLADAPWIWVEFLLDLFSMFSPMHLLYAKYI